MEPESVPAFRIGELSRRTAIRAQLLRAREGRYGLLQSAGRRADTGCPPKRTSGGSAACRLT
jgi:hypothetical protein